MNTSSSDMSTMTKKTSIGLLSWFLLHSLSLKTTVHARSTAARSYRLRGLESVVLGATEEEQQEPVLGFDEIPPSSELCVSEGGRVGATWISEPGQGASIADWVTAGEYCCSGACKYYEIAIAGTSNETGSANCECGPEVSPSSPAKEEYESGSITCVSNGGEVNFNSDLRLEESAVGFEFPSSFCCSGQCEVATAGSSLSLLGSVTDEDGEPVFDKNGDTLLEEWASASQRCVCGVPPSYPVPLNATSSEIFVEGEEVAELKGETLAPLSVVTEFADSP